jgi:hypothetical protein
VFNAAWVFNAEAAHLLLEAATSSHSFESID